MANPYAGSVGYNAAIDDAIRVTAATIDAAADGDERLITFGLKIMTQIAGLQRRQRHRRTKAEMIAAQQQTDEQNGDSKNGV